MAIYIGVDGGGSKTELVLCDPAKGTWVQASVGGTNPTRVGWEEVERRCASLVFRAKEALDAGSSAVSVFLAMAGADREESRHAFAAIWTRLLGAAARVEVVSDAHAAVLAAFLGDPGIVLVAGTGTIAFRLDEDGTLTRTGGWGYLLGDEGGGYDLGQKTLRAAVLAKDGRGPQTVLWDAVARELHVSTIDDLILPVYNPSFTQERVASFARLALEAATGPTPDPAAAELARDAARAHAALIARLLPAHSDTDGIPVGVSGGLYGSEEPLWPMLRALLPQCRLFRVSRRPVLGALLGACVTAGETKQGARRVVEEAESRFSSSARGVAQS